MEQVTFEWGGKEINILSGSSRRGRRFSEEMSCWRRTTVLRIPAAALGFRYRKEWDAFLKEHDDEFGWEPGEFGESLSDDFPSTRWWREADFSAPDWRLDQRNPACPEIVPGPFLDYCLDEIIPLHPEDNSYGRNDVVRPLDDGEKEEYLPLYQELFPHFTLEDMANVRWCRYEWYDGSEAAYLYSDLELYSDVE